jgi:hypothetical protein
VPSLTSFVLFPSDLPLPFLLSFPNFFLFVPFPFYPFEQVNLIAKTPDGQQQKEGGRLTCGVDEEEGQEENEKGKRMRGWNDFGDGKGMILNIKRKWRMIKGKREDDDRGGRKWDRRERFRGVV